MKQTQFMIQFSAINEFENWTWRLYFQTSKTDDKGEKSQFFM